ncbi:MAG: AAA family ATPase, partial [Chlamydiia bacterium]|nr:AAA family ATPase [Chlamydiia bacterium]
MSKSIFIASTGQHVGKTTTCLGLMAGLRKRFQSVGFIKPVGQEHVLTDTGIRVDKDVLIFHKTFELTASLQSMSPVLFPRGFTRDYLDGKIDAQKLLQAVELAHQDLTAHNDMVLVEGTGHTGVGSICDINNATIAKHLGTDMIMIASGGLGSSFDAIAVNKALCDQHGVRIAGIILNRVLDDKRQMITDYMAKALKRWDIPLLGCIPFDPFLSN